MDMIEKFIYLTQQKKLILRFDDPMDWPIIGMGLAGGADTDETGGVISVIRPPVFFLSSPRCRTGAIVIIGYVCIAVDHGQVSATKFINFAGPIAGFMAINRGQEPFLKCGIVVERCDKWPYNRYV